MRPARTLWTAPLLLLLSGCQGCGAAVGGPQPTQGARPRGEGASAEGADLADTRDPSRAPSAQSAQTVQGAQGTPAPSGSAPELILRAESGPQGVELVLQNHDDDTVAVRSAVAIERAAGDAFEALPATQMSLRASCAVPAPACLELVPGAELRPERWRGAQADAQCGCTQGPACGHPPAGRYRFVVTSCDGAHRVRGDVFTLPSR